jgi:hypothetical protein
MLGIKIDIDYNIGVNQYYIFIPYLFLYFWNLYGSFGKVPTRDWMKGTNLHYYIIILFLYHQYVTNSLEVKKERYK